MNKGYKRYVNWKKDKSLAEIYQIYSKGMEFAFLSARNEQCNQFVWCKDFLQDMIYACLNEKWIDIYQFRYNPYIDPKPCMDKIRLLVANANDSKFRIKIKNSLDLVNQAEERLSMKKSILRECWSPPENFRKSGVWLFEGSKRWLNSPPMLSLYSLLIRVGCAHTVGISFEKTINDIINGDVKPYQKKDALWLKHAKPGIEKIFRIGDRKIFLRNTKENYPNLPIDEMHNQLGINGFSADMQDITQGRSVAVPYWHYLK